MITSRFRRAALCAIALLAFTVVAACAKKKSEHQNPLVVYDDIYVTGQANNRVALDGDTAWIVNSLSDTVFDPLPPANESPVKRATSAMVVWYVL